jgi:hypothetical protein
VAKPFTLSTFTQATDADHRDAVCPEVLPQKAANLKPVHIWQPIVEQNQIRTVLSGKSQDHPATGCTPHFIRLTGQESVQVLQDGQGVIDYEEAALSDFPVASIHDPSL